MRHRIKTLINLVGITMENMMIPFILECGDREDVTPQFMMIPFILECGDREDVT
jgi:hypothetical protein